MSSLNKGRENTTQYIKIVFRTLSIVANTIAVYDFFIEDWTGGAFFGISWLLILLAEKRYNKVPVNNELE